MLGGIGDFRLVVDETTSKELVKFLRAELSVNHALCFIGGIPWVDVWAAVQVLVYILDNNPLGGRTLLVLCLKCG